MLRPLLAVTAAALVARVAAQEVQRYTNLIQTRNKATNETSKAFCILDYVYDRNVTQLQKRNRFYDLTSLYSFLEKDLCQSDNPYRPDVDVKEDLKGDPTNKFVLINYSSDCNINDQISYFKDKSIYGLFISIGCSVDIDGGINITNQTLLDNKFSVSLISQTSVDQILSSDANQLKLFNIDFETSLGYGFDYSIVCIWLLATFTVTLGAFWSGSVRKNIFQINKLKTTRTAKSETDAKDGTKNGPKSAEEEAFINLSPFLVLGFVLLMALMLVLLYYFFQYLVYVIIFLFTLASIASLFACSEPIVLYLLPESVTKASFLVFNVRCGRMYYYQLVLLIGSISLSVVWFVYRKETFSWILQDLLGVCFSLNMLRTIRLPSYKICVILLSALFFYDIFFVFITPLITSKGNSVMVDVATGGSGKSRCGKPGEQIPMIMKIPHKIFQSENSTDPYDVCFTNRDSLLGFGDILVPGLLVSYCYAFDLIFDVKYRIYYATTCICYGLGLIATFAGLYLMSGSAQPALLYLVPFTTIPPILISLYRKEFQQLWAGPEAFFLGPNANNTNKTDNSIEDNNLLIGESQQSVPQTNS